METLGTIITKDTFGQETTYRLIDKLPGAAWYVWNIGDNMGSDTHIPIVRDDPHGRPFHIDESSLCAIELPASEVAILRKAATIGANNLATAIAAALKRRDKVSRHMCSDKELAEAIEIFKKIT